MICINCIRLKCHSGAIVKRKHGTRHNIKMERKKKQIENQQNIHYMCLCVVFLLSLSPFFSLTLNSVFPAKHFQHLITNENRIANKYGNRYLQFSGLLMEPEQQSSIICLLLLLFNASDFSFVSAFITKQTSKVKPCAIQ